VEREAAVGKGGRRRIAEPGRAMEEERGRNGLVGALGLPALLLVRAV